MVVDMNLGPKVRGLGRRFWLQATALGLLPRAPAHPHHLFQKGK